MTDIFTPRRRGGVRILAAAVVLAVVTGLTLAPPSIAAPARRLFLQATVTLAEPLVLWIPVDLAERVLNTLLFVPLGATVALLLSRRQWPVAVLAGAALSITVESVQDSIPGRVPDLSDVIWNTVGAAIGVLLVTVPRVVASAVTRSRMRGAPAAPAPPQPGSLTRT